MTTDLVAKPNAVMGITFVDMQNMAKVLVGSQLFGMKTVDQALGLMLIAQAHGRHPALVAEEYDIIQGRPAMKAHAMLARYQDAGGTVKWIERTDTASEAEFTHPQSGSVKIRWTYEMAKTAQLTNKDNYKRHPRQMLSARVVSEGVKASFPGCIGAVYTPEEVVMFEPQKADKVDAEVVESLPASDQNQPEQDMTPKVREEVAECLGLEDLRAYQFALQAKGFPWWTKAAVAIIAERKKEIESENEIRDMENQAAERGA